MSTINKSTKIFITACQAWYVKCAHYFYVKLLKPKSSGEDNIRSERILTFILFTILLITLIFEISIIGLLITAKESYTGIPISTFTILLLIFTSLYIATRKGHHRVAGFVFISIMFSAIFYTSYIWGASLPMALLSYGLVVTMASIIINSRFGFFIAILACTAIIIIGLDEHFSQIVPDWKQGAIEKRDVFGYGIMILLTALLSRLSNREMEKSLQRARTSEQALKEERDNLEIIVEERTKALRESERERMRELYRFAEFGKLSGGIFHDLLNPLTAVSLSVEQLAKTSGAPSSDAAKSIETAVIATKRMEQFMTTVRKQIKSEDLRGDFSLNEEIEDAIDLIRHKADKAHVSVTFSALENITVFGNPLKYNQVMTNLISNAIDALEIKTSGTITITLTKKENVALCTVADNGPGIATETLKNIFTPFFTTKEKGLGLGLSTTKDIIEEHFGGTITCESTLGVGTNFIISIPLSNHEHEPQKNNREKHPQRI
jgi:signal transduction histidine kinase